jgi:hypothetical protein
MNTLRVSGRTLNWLAGQPGGGADLVGIDRRTLAGLVGRAAARINLHLGRPQGRVSLGIADEVETEGGTWIIQWGTRYPNEERHVTDVRKPSREKVADLDKMPPQVVAHIKKILGTGPGNTILDKPNPFAEKEDIERFWKQRMEEAPKANKEAADLKQKALEKQRAADKDPSLDKKLDAEEAAAEYFLKMVRNVGRFMPEGPDKRNAIDMWYSHLGEADLRLKELKEAKRTRDLEQGRMVPTAPWVPRYMPAAVAPAPAAQAHPPPIQPAALLVPAPAAFPPVATSFAWRGWPAAAAAPTQPAQTARPAAQRYAPTSTTNWTPAAPAAPGSGLPFFSPFGLPAGSMPVSAAAFG